MRRRRPSLIATVMALLAVLALLANACGGSDDESGSADDTTGATATTTLPSVLTSETEAALEQALDEAFPATGVPGVIVGVWQGDDPEGWTATRGVSDTTTQAPVALDGFTRIGSVTKTVTGTLVLQLVDEGKLSLDDTIDAWFPELPDGDQITVRMLGDMSSGIDSYNADEEVLDRYFADPQQAWTPEELIEAGTAMPRKFPPGEGFFYSNTNFLMLGMIVEELGGQPLPIALQERIFDPLGLDASSYPDTSEIPDPHWQGYSLQGSTDGERLDATDWSPTFSGAAGQMISDLDDMRVWARALGRGELIEPATQAERLQTNPASASPRGAYAFGIGDQNGWLGHSGVLPGFNSQIAYLPDLDITIVVLTNSDDPGPDGNPAPAIFEALAAVVAPDHPPVTT